MFNYEMNIKSNLYTECTPNKTEGYDGCRTIDITALNEELQDILNALPGGRFEKTIRGIVTIIIDK